MSNQFCQAALLGLLAAVASSVQGVEVLDPTVLPKVPSQSTILSGSKTSDDKIDQWIQGLISTKEKRANVELDKIKRELQEEERKRQAEERERRRREQRLEESYGALGPVLKREEATALRIKLDFQVPEIESFNEIVKILEREQALSRDIVDALTRLDRDGDGRLTQDEYRDAGAIVSATRRMFEKIDKDNDGSITPKELESALELPSSSAAAISAGRSVSDSPNFLIKPYDVKEEGVLDVSERKALTMAFVDVALKAEQEAVFYRQVVAKLTNAREVVAAKFADIEIKP